MAGKQLPIYITDRARAEVSHIFEHKNIPKGYGLRIGVKGGGCAGISYLIGFDKPKPTDDKFEDGPLTILIEKKHLMHLLGLKIDFVDTDLERGFIFMNPDEQD